jgi:hypothetical protein
LKSRGVVTPAPTPTDQLSKNLEFSVAICALAPSTAKSAAKIKINFFMLFFPFFRFILNLIRSKINSKKGAEFGIAGLTLLVDCCTANNTVAIVMAGPIAKEISEEQ